MARREKILLIAAIFIAILALILLAAGFPKLELRPGTVYFTEGSVDQGNFYSSEVLEKGEDMQANYNLLLVLALLGPIILLVLILIFMPRARKLVLRNLIILLGWTVAIYYVFTREATAPVFEGETEFEPLVQDLPEVPQSPLPEFVSDSPNWVVYIIGFIFILLLLSAVYFLYVRSQKQEDGLELLAEEAQVALNEIQSGLDLRNAILRCYVEMSKILQRERGIQRKKWMTPREFERRLLSSGLPEGPVQNLTYLFEFVRYGGADPSEDQENLAIQCLASIAQSSGEGS